MDTGYIKEGTRGGGGLKKVLGGLRKERKCKLYKFGVANNLLLYNLFKGNPFNQPWLRQWLRSMGYAINAVKLNVSHNCIQLAADWTKLLTTYRNTNYVPVTL